MCIRDRRITHVVQAVVHGDEIEAVLGDLLRICHLEAHTIAKAMILGMTPRLLDRRLVKIETDEMAVRICLRHQQRRKAHPTADIGDPSPGMKPRFHTIEGGDPCLDDIVDITRPEKGPGGTEQAAGMVAPAYALAVPKTCLLYTSRCV